MLQHGLICMPHFQRKVTTWKWRTCELELNSNELKEKENQELVLTMSTCIEGRTKSARRPEPHRNSTFRNARQEIVQPEQRIQMTSNVSHLTPPPKPTLISIPPLHDNSHTPALSLPTTSKLQQCSRSSRQKGISCSEVCSSRLSKRCANLSLTGYFLLTIFII